jgi:imidazoleglycerol phosphate synthase cyclase subunit
MLTRRVIACLDIRAGQVVKGTRFRDLQNMGNPAELAALYEKQGADEIVVLDVSATLEERAAAIDAVKQVRSKLSIPLTVGGGVREVTDVAKLLAAGADKVAINSAAVATPQLLSWAADQFGKQCIVLAIDARRDRSSSGWQVVVRSGSSPTMLDAVAWAREGVDRGCGEILLTSVDRDGTGSGYDGDLIEAVSAAVSVPVIASGGASNSADMLAAIDRGADAVLAAGIFHRGEWTVADVKQKFQQHAVEVRA